MDNEDTATCGNGRMLVVGPLSDVEGKILKDQLVQIGNKTWRAVAEAVYI